MERNSGLLIYNKDWKRVYHDIYDFVIYGSGSSGNSVELSPYQSLIDIGLPYAKYPENLFNRLKYILLTHEHGDHLHLATVNRINNHHSHIKFVIPKRLISITQDKLASKGYPALPESKIIPIEFDETLVLDLPDDDVFSVHATKTPHGDIDNVAYTLKGFKAFDQFESPTILYSSDLSTTLPYSDPLNDIHYPGLPKDEKYDIMFLEANYDLFELLKTTYTDAEVQQFIDDKLSLNEIERNMSLDTHDTKARGNLRHLSEQDAFGYVNTQLSKDGIYIPLHASRDFGTFIHEIDNFSKVALPRK